MKLLYCAFKPHFREENKYYTNGSIPDFLPELSKYFKKIYFMVPVANKVPKGMTKLNTSQHLEVVETNLYGNRYINFLQFYTWSLSPFNFFKFKKYQNMVDIVLIAVPTSLLYLAYIPLINKPLVLLIAGNEQELLKSSTHFIFKIERLFGIVKLRSLLEKHLCNKSEVIICRSTKFKKIISQKYGLKEEKINVITSGVRTDLFKPFELEYKIQIKSNLGIDQNTIVIGFVANSLSYQKGLDILLETFEILRTEYSNVRLLLIGNKKMDINENDSHIFCGPIEKELLPVYYNAMDFFVFPSRSEGAPKVIMEANSCGIPTIASSVGGIPELIIDGQNGYTVNSEDVINIVKYCKILIENKELREEMGRRARNIALRKFDFNVLCNNFQSAIHKASMEQQKYEKQI